MQLRPISSVGVAHADPRASLAALLSFLFPGLGQAYNREPRLAGLLAVPVLVVIGGGITAWWLVGSGLLSLLLDARVLVALIVLDLALLGWRLVAVAQAHVRRERPDARRWTLWTTALLLVAVVGMHALPAWYALKAIDTLDSVALGGSEGDDLGDVFPDFVGLPTPSDPPQVERGERVNVLLVGVDSAPGRVTALTDTMLVVSLDPAGGASAMVSVPRDLYGVPLPDGRPFNRKLNSLMTFAGSRPEEFPLGGVGTLKATIGGLLGLEIHYFGAINLLGFQDAIDTIGGVDVTVTRAVNDPTYMDAHGQMVGFFIQPGTYHMDGSMALAFVRSRKGAGDNDFTRADRQQQLLTAMREQLTAGNLLLALPGLLDAVRDAVVTDIPADQFAVLARAVQDADMSQLRRIVLQPPTYMTADPDSSAGYILIPDLEAIRAIGEALTAEPSPTPVPSG